jgi:hypothetical protein
MNDGSFTSREDFEYWLATIDAFLEEFKEKFPAAERGKLDFTPESLDVVEAWILSTYADTDDMLRSSESRRVNGAACYVGEVFRKIGNGKWTVNLEDRDFAYYGMPIIAAPRKDAECPLTVVTTAADRRTGKFLRTLLNNY